MKKFWFFIKKIYVLLLFVIFVVVAMNYYANSTSYTKAKMLTASNAVVGGIYKQFSSVGEYFGLRQENDALVARIARLNNEFEIYKQLNPSVETTTFEGDKEVAQYIYIPASVINKSVTRPENYITLDKGRRDGVEPNMAIVTPQNTIVGYVLNCSDKFSIGIAILNANFKTGGKIKHTDNFGSVSWNGLDHGTVTLSEIPKYAEIAVGDTILTENSSIFPPDVMIGTVEGFRMTQSSYYDVDVALATNFSELKKVFLVRYSDIVERMMLEEQAAGGPRN